MPAHLRALHGEAAEDLVGIKWITGFPANNAAGRPALNALVILNDPATGIPVAILDGGPITAARTAAVSGVAIRHFHSALAAGERPRRAALIGAGVQARSHLPVLGHLVPGVEVALFDRHPERAAALAELAASTSGIGRAEVSSSARAAIQGADLVITCASFGPVRQVMTGDWLTPEALVVPVDYATYCSAEVARGASLFLVDERGQFLAARAAGLFDGYPGPSATLGEALLANMTRPPGRVVATHLGTGLTDLIFAQAIIGRAAERDLGILLAR